MPPLHIRSNTQPFFRLRAKKSTENPVWPTGIIDTRLSTSEINLPFTNPYRANPNPNRPKRGHPTKFGHNTWGAGILRTEGFRGNLGRRDTTHGGLLGEKSKTVNIRNRVVAGLDEHLFWCFFFFALRDSSLVRHDG